MSKSQFEKLIEYVINDEEAKARELFHEIVVEKSRNIYESIMDEEDDSIEEGMDEQLGGDQSDSLINGVEADEQQMEADDMGADDDGMGEPGMDDGMGEPGMGDEMGGGDEEPATKSDIMDLEMKLEDFMDQLMSEFENELGDTEGGEFDDTPDMTGQEVDADELETEGMMEAVTLKAAPKPVTSEPAGTNTRSINDNNSGSKGPIGGAVKPVHMTGTEAQGRPAPTAKDLIGKVGNSPSQGTQDPKPATKPHLSQASGVNTKSINLGRKG